MDLPLDEEAFARIDTIIAGAGTAVGPSPDGIGRNCTQKMGIP
ncbi:MAG: hypothetical protein WB383_01940 [Acidimicrobiales bacterium]